MNVNAVNAAYYRRMRVTHAAHLRDDLFVFGASGERETLHDALWPSA